jgi:hypothetical protein
MFQQYLAGDVNLWGIFFMFGGLISVAAIVVVVARTFPVRVCRSFIFIIFGRRLWRCSVFTPLLLFEKLKKAKEEMSEKSKEKNSANSQELAAFPRKTTWVSLARGTFLTTSLPLVNQNSLANLVLMTRTSSLGRSLEVLEALRNYGSFSRNFTRSAQSKS